LTRTCRRAAVQPSTSGGYSARSYSYSSSSNSSSNSNSNSNSCNDPQKEDPREASTLAGFGSGSGAFAGPGRQEMPSWPVVLNFDANQAAQTITYDGVLVWGDVSQNKRLEALPDDYLTYHPRDLIAVDAKRKTKNKLKKKEEKGGRESDSSSSSRSDDDDDNDGGDDGGECRLLPRMLARVVGSTSPLRGESAGWAKHVARLTNLDRPAVQEKGNRPLSELYFHQLVFSPVAGLFYCFHPETYVANESVSSGYGCASLTTNKRKGAGGSASVTLTRRTHHVPFVCRMDAACLATAHEFVLAALHVTDNDSGKLDTDGMFDCALMTCMAAVAMVQQGVVAAADTSSAVFVPFVVNVGENAILYVATMATGDAAAPAVHELCRANFSRRSERVRFVALLACLLHRLKELLGTTPAGTALIRLLERLPLPPRRTSSSGSTGTDHNRRRCGHGERDDTRGKIQDDPDDPGSAMAALGAASLVASCEGRVADLVALGTGYADSPFYFGGGAVRTGTSAYPAAHATATPAAAPAAIAPEALSLPVFVKVWREGDERTSLKSIRRERELLDRAHQAGVPCPAVVPALTELSILHDGDVFHRLAMDRVANGAVDRSDLNAYALCLVEAVLRLHAAGILHCDIKPANVAWDAAAKAAFLLDLGLSRREKEGAASAAASFAGTKGYTAPEVEQRLEPHSRRSDAYSVGRTILAVAGRQFAARTGTSPTLGEVVDVARLLCRGASDGRISLEDALERLERPSRWPSSCRRGQQIRTGC
jgi:Protein kinase domain